MIVCRFCGSGNTRTVGGPNGDPFDRQPEKTVCMDCGRTLYEETVEAGVEMPDVTAVHVSGLGVWPKKVLKPMVRLTVTAQAANTRRTVTRDFPFTDGSHDISQMDYPFSRFGSFTLAGSTVTLGRRTYTLGNEPVKDTLQDVAYGYDRYAWTETIDITIVKTWVMTEQQLGE